jgi:hypothetical protein
LPFFSGLEGMIRWGEEDGGQSLAPKVGSDAERAGVGWSGV